MRILVVSDLPQFVTGGAEMQASRLIEAWCDAGHEVVCLGRRMGRGPVRLGTHRIVVHRIRSVAGCGRALRGATYFASLALWLLRYRRWTDVVYTRFLGEAATTAALLRRAGFLQAPLVATPANAGDTGDAHFVASMPFAQYLLPVLDAECGAINLIAPDMERGLRAVGFRGRNFTHVPNGIPLHAAPQRPAQRDRRILLAVGRLAPQKGYDVLLRAFARVDASLRAQAVLRIAGDGPERASLQALATQLGIDGHVQWLGEVAPGHVRDQLAEADAFLLPSRYEGLSNAALEAMEAALPMLLTDCGGIDRHVDASMAWVVPREDVDALAHALAHALCTPWRALRTMGELARARVAQTFDLREVAARYLALFDELRRQ